MVDIAQSLTRKIGPFPAWGWGVGIGGGVLVAQMLRGRGSSASSSDTATDTTQTEDVDTSTVTSQGQRGEKGETGKTGEKGETGKDAPTAPARPKSPGPGWTPQYDPSTNKWVFTYTPRPAYSAGENREWYWADPPGTWATRATESRPVASGSSVVSAPKIVSDRGAGGLAASSNSMPTLSLADIGGVTIASPDGTPRPTVSTIRKNPIGMTPNIAGQRPRSLSRQVGRPFYGV